MRVLERLGRICRRRVGGAREPSTDGALRETLHEASESVRNPRFALRFAPRTLQGRHHATTGGAA